jgi:hypothetical protein
MSFQISWTIEGDKQFSRRLRGLDTDLKDFTKPLKRIADSLIKTFSTDVFSTQGGAVQESWAALSPYTLATKARKGYPLVPLIATGAMQKGFRSIVSSDQAVISNIVDYFKYHQSNKPRSHLPRRVMMKLGFQQKELIQKEFQRFIMDSKNKN